MYNKKIAVITVLTVIIIGSFLFTACGMQKVDKTKKNTPPKEKIIVGTFSKVKPFTFKNERDEHVGYDIDLINEIAKRLNIDIEFKDIFFLDLFSARDSGEIDLAISGITITPDRQKNFLFSSPYINVGQIIVTLKENESIESVSDVEGKRIGVTKGTTLENSAKKLTSDELISTFDDLDEGVEALREKKVDALARDYVEAIILVRDNPDLKMAGSPYVQDYYGIMTGKSSTELVNRIDNVIGEMNASGYLKQLRVKWLGE